MAQYRNDFKLIRVGKKGGTRFGSGCLNHFKSQLCRVFAKLFEVLFPFHGKQLLFGVVAFLAARRHVSLGAFSTPG